MFYRVLYSIVPAALITVLLFLLMPYLYGGSWMHSAPHFKGHGYEDPIEGPWDVVEFVPRPSACSFIAHHFDLSEISQTVALAGADELRRANHEYVWSDAHSTDRLVSASILKPGCQRIYIEVRTRDDWLVGREEYIVYDAYLQEDGLGRMFHAWHESIPGLSHVVYPALISNDLYAVQSNHDAIHGQRIGRVAIFVRFNTAEEFAGIRCRRTYRCRRRR